MVIMSLTDLPVELVHRIFDYCDITTILSVRAICRQLYLMANVYDRYELDYDYQSADELSLIIRLIRPENLNSIILPFRTPFWLDEKRWLVACDFLLEAGDSRIYTIPAIFVPDWNPYRCELFPLDSVPRLTWRSIKKHINTSTDKVF
ncbi:unnamed protein product [Rotaria sp. Silwood1]|nr:unnamed protein product [Rotaria sp. Silwood1]